MQQYFEVMSNSKKVLSTLSIEFMADEWVIMFRSTWLRLRRFSINGVFIAAVIDLIKILKTTWYAFNRSILHSSRTTRRISSLTLTTVENLASNFSSRLFMQRWL